MARPAGSFFKQFRPRRSVLVVLAVAVVALYAVIPQIGRFHNSLALWRHAGLPWLGAALLAVLASYCIAAAAYMFLAWKPLNYTKTVVVQVAGMFVNRVLPAGMGALGVNYFYLRRHRHTKPQAAATLAANNIMGFLGNLVLIACLLVFKHSRVMPYHMPSARVWWWAVGVVLAVILILVWQRRLRRKIWAGVVSIIRVLAQYRRRPGRLAMTLAAAVLLALCYTFCLFACARALGINAGFTTLFVAMTVGVAGSVVVPTPGGLGGAEAGLVVALMFYGVSGREALAAALLYRVFTYWLPLLLGLAAFVFVEKRRYI